MRRLATLRGLIWAIALASAPWPAAAQEEPAPETAHQPAAPERAFFDVVDVSLVNVEVYVTDRKGDPVTGLTQDDFVVLEDGRQVTITNFYAEEPPAGDQPAPRAPALPPGTPGAAPAEEVPEDQRLFLVVYIDNFNIRPFNRNRVFRRLREFLNENVGRHDKVMLVTYERSFHERVSFTSDPGLINAALYEIETESGHGVHADSERRDVLHWIEESESVSHAMVRVRQYAGSLFNDLMFTIDALKEMVSNVGGLPGRKALLYVSDGLPQVAGEDVYYALHEKYRDSSMLLGSRDYDASRRFQELAALANGSRVTFYTIDAGGLRTLTAASVEQTRAGASSYVDSQHIHNLQAPLLQLAEATGGRAIINTNDVGPALQEVARDLRSYYSLGYSPAHVGDGRYHRIEVRVKQKGLRVRHRDGYRDKSLQQRMGDGTMAALLFGETGNPLGLGLDFGRPMPRDGGNFLVPVQVRIPLDQVVLVPQGESWEGRLRVFVAASDEEGGLSPVQEAALPITVPAADLDIARQQGWGYDLTLLMRRGYHRVAIGLRDDLGGTQSFVTGGLRVEGR